MGNSNNIEKGEKVGFKVIEVDSGSPGAKCGLVAFTDFIVNVNGYALHTLSRDNIEYLVQRSENRMLQIEVYSTASETTRLLEITPSRDWPGEGLLGIVIRLEPLDSDKSVESETRPVGVKSPGPQTDLDVSFDSIYKDFEASPRATGRISTTRMFSRKSAGGGGGTDDSLDMTENYMTSSSGDREEVESPSARRQSTSAKILKALTFSASSPKAGHSDTTDDTSPQSPDSTTSSSGKTRRKSSHVFKRFSFTS